MNSKKAYFGWGLTLLDYQNVNDANYAELTSEDWENAIELLERNFIDLIKANLPIGADVADEYHYSDYGIESVTFGSSMPAKNIDDKLRELGYEWIRDGIYACYTSNGSLRLTPTLESLDGRFDLELEIQFQEPVKY